MNVATHQLPWIRQSRHWRAVILAAASLLLLGVFWFASRYPQLLVKSSHLGQALPSMAYGKEVLALPTSAEVWQRIFGAALSWLDSMKIGMSFGILFGALLHTALKHYPMKMGSSRYLNSIKGALVGVPMGVCANCAVPAACGVTRGNGRIEMALGFLFSSPNFNPVVVAMTFTALPLAMSVTKYVVLAFVILAVVPLAIGWLERSRVAVPAAAAACEVPVADLPQPQESFFPVLKELAREYARHVWMLLKPTVTIMLFASVLAAALLVLIPWPALLAEVTPLRLAAVSLLAVFMPVPIALDVMFAAQLGVQGVSPAYVMLFAMTLGTYSIVPTVYLWREVSKRLALLLFFFFALVGWVLALAFS